MAWQWFSCKGKPKLVFASCNMDSLRSVIYSTLLKHRFLKLSNASCHTSQGKKHKSFQYESSCFGVDCALSKCQTYRKSCVVLVHKVLNNCRQFDCVEDLNEVLTNAWEHGIRHEVLVNVNTYFLS